MHFCGNRFSGESHDSAHTLCKESVLTPYHVQVMKDIPYGDNFKVDTRWNISSTPNGCHVGVYGSVPFVRHVISPIRMMIESSVMKEVRESMSTLFSLLSDTLIESTSPSLPEPSRDERKWSGRLSDNLDNILGHEDLRAKLVNLLREGLGDSDVQKGRNIFWTICFHFVTFSFCFPLDALDKERPTP